MEPSNREFICCKVSQNYYKETYTPPKETTRPRPTALHGIKLVCSCIVTSDHHKPGTSFQLFQGASSKNGKFSPKKSGFRRIPRNNFSIFLQKFLITIFSHSP